MSKKKRSFQLQPLVSTSTGVCLLILGVAFSLLYLGSSFQSLLLISFVAASLRWAFSPVFTRSSILFEVLDTHENSQLRVPRSTLTRGCAEVKFEEVLAIYERGPVWWRSIVLQTRLREFVILKRSFANYEEWRAATGLLFELAENGRLGSRELSYKEERQPVVGLWLAAVLVLVHCYRLLAYSSPGSHAMLHAAAWSSEDSLDSNSFCRLVAAGLFHFDWLHLLVNAGAMSILAGYAKVHWSRSQMFLGLLLGQLGGLLLGVPLTGVYRGEVVATVGISPGLFALLGMLAVSTLTDFERVAPRYRLVGLWWLQLALWYLAAAVLMSRIDHGAHVVGLLIGVLYGYCCWHSVRR